MQQYGYSDGAENRSTFNISEDSSRQKIATNISVHEFLKIVNEEAARKEWFPLQIELPLITSYALLMLFGMIANGLICYVVAKKKKLRTARNLFIINLSVSDILMCMICMPFTLFKLVRKDWTLGLLMCKTLPGLQALNVFASTFSTMAIALDRYNAIVEPSRVVANDSNTVPLIVMLIIWVVSLTLSVPFFMYNTLHEAKYIEDIIAHRICMELWPTMTVKAIYTFSVIVVQFILPVTVLLIIHWRICAFLRQRVLESPSTPVEMSRALKDTQRVRKNTSLLVAIAIVFAISWFPLGLLNILADLNYKILMSKNFNLTYACCHLVAMSTSSTNPIIYGWLNGNFRREFSAAIFFWRHKPSYKSRDSRSEQRMEVLQGSKRRTSSYDAVGQSKAITKETNEN
ncbi:neuropeptide F receptor-like [Tubulanus polymorphus]|uniref:neuropeptide F receptor-like n=1 Tax=Tubulanus polymorphus TaxID=672921 RepID=UPI003DA4FE1D